MARPLPLASLLLGALGIVGIVGCQARQPEPAGGATRLPPPNLDGPVLRPPATRPAATAPAVAIARAALPAAPRTSPAAAADPVPADWIPPIRPHPWAWIVIHHSATPNGSAEVFDRQHRAKGWDELGYHFVVGNGTFSPDGAIEVGSRWPKQKWGAHARTPDQQFNNFGIGICLVGNFDVDRPSSAQVRSLARLTAYLMRTYRIPADRIIGHGQTKPTDCPGRNCNLAEVRRLASLYLAEAPSPLDAGQPRVPAPVRTSAQVSPPPGELLRPLAATH